MTSTTTTTDALKAAERRATRFLLPAHEHPEDRADAKAQAVALLEQATEALRLADRTDLALRVLAMRQEAEA